MGLFSVILKLTFVLIVLGASYLLTFLIVNSGQLAPSYLGFSPTPQGELVSFASDALTLLASVFVGACFTVPLLLAMFGHAGAWFRHVISKTAKHLSLGLLSTFALFIAAGAVSGVNFSQTGVSQGIGSAIVVGAIGLLLLVVVSRSTALEVAARTTDGVLSSARFVCQLPVGRREVSTATVELRETPLGQVRGKEKPKKIRSEAIRFQRFVQSLTALGGRTEFRLQFGEGRGRILLSVSGRIPLDELQQSLLSIVRAHLPEFKVETLGHPAGATNRASCCLCISGVPEALENPLEPLSRYFLENNYAGDYSVILERSWSNPLRKALSRREQKKLAEKAGGQKTKGATLQGEQRSNSVRDYAEEVKLEDSVKQLERHDAALALRCSVYVTAYAATQGAAAGVARGASSVIVGALSGHRSGTALKVTTVAGGIGRLRPKGTDTILLPKEAIPYIWIPQVAMGSEIAPSAEFELPPVLKGEIQLGTIASQSGQTAHLAKIPLDVLVKHVFVTGMTGTGKTTTCFNLLLQLYEHGIPFLVIEPVKTEYRSLLTSIPGLQVFTPGDEGTAPFRLNIFEPPEGVKIQTHLENLEAAWNASFVMYSPLPYVVKEVFHQTYRSCGWSLKLNTRGRPITLADFRQQSEKVARNLGYEPKVLMDIEAALRTRITSLTLGGKSPMFDTLASIPVETLLRRPTVIELRNIPNNEEKAFVAALLLSNIVEYIETKGSSRHLTHLTLIEEAHRLLPNVSTQKGDPEGADPRKRMVEQFANMLAELRAYGEGLAIVEQIPTKILPDAIKNTATKIVHRVPAADDREILAGAMNLTEEQSAVLTGLKPGEAVISLERHPLPIRIVAANTTEKLGIPLGEVADEEVKRHMVEFYLRNPLPKAPADLHRAEMLALVDAVWFRAKFLEAYQKWSSDGDWKPLAALVMDSARKFTDDGENAFGFGSEILTLAVGSYLPFTEEDRAKFPRLFMQRLERSMRDGRRG